MRASVSKADIANRASQQNTLNARKPRGQAIPCRKGVPDNMPDDDMPNGLILNIRKDNYNFLEIPLSEARTILDGGEFPEEFFTKLDEAQAAVFGGDHDITLLILIVSRDPA